ncbi:hypothetical protein F5B22DRAFT_650823 [Xylaria bambusicola]|uniref:uncharacterized protein n=1 Tax=Xylaria bambusicola TaxID=326684 RepID=UPI0020081E14|nr:uncharacterized protein F5B22DRAFT_650823 [Xylaria bambusicola]KAI0506265.1 hypothetical protein F5B22DRAFT_650823 [Xylaria bambusicola]
MAAPSEINVSDVTGRWALNRALSDQLEPLFTLQGIPWIIRKVINFASLELQYTKDPPSDPTAATSFSFKQTVRPGGFDTINRYVLDGDKRTDTVPIFGEVTMYAKYLNRDEVTLEQTLGTGIQGDAEKDVAIIEVTESKSMGWKAETVWVFETIDGEYRLCKYNRIWKGDQSAKAKMVHDYIGPPN